METAATIRKKADDLRRFTLARRWKNIFVRGRQKLLINARRTRRWWRLLCQYLNGSTINRGKNGSNEGIWFSRWWWLFMDSHDSSFHPTFRPHGLPTICWPNLSKTFAKTCAENFTRVLRSSPRGREFNKDIRYARRISKFSQAPRLNPLHL